MCQHPAEIVSALAALASEVKATRAVLGIKHHYEAAIDRLRPHAEAAGVELALLADQYPMGDEHVLVHEVTGRVVPEGGIPLQVGVVVQNTSTLLNIHHASKGIPVILKHVTVAGHVARPGVFLAPVGTPAGIVLGAAGGATIPDYRVLEGGPMMGNLLPDLLAPVVKTTSGYLVLPPDSPVVARRCGSMTQEFRRTLAVCCQCRMCTDLCPRYLLGHRIKPNLAMRAVHAGLEEAPDVIAMGHLCSQCGVCQDYACPLGLSPKRVFGAFKEKLASTRTPNPYKNRPEAPLPEQAWARVPKARLTGRLGLAPFVPPGSGEPIRIPEPWEVRIPLKQHLGAPAKATVKAGDRVRAGDVVGIPPEGALGARVHASMDGTVSVADGREVRITRGA
jgi:Na+-translocating ferredoxin:NAD+ oxidoreductase RnfC subunit